MEFPQKSLGFLIADLSRLMRHTFAQRIEGSSLTLAQAKALAYLSRHEGMRQVELAEMLDIQPITLARLIDHLSEEGLVERHPDPADRRAYRLYLTAAAAPQLEAINRVVATIRADALRDMKPQEIDRVMEALSKIRENLLAVPRTDRHDSEGNSR